MEDTAIFAGGCFWCMVKPFDTMPGIKQVISGYTGGHVANPTYEQVASHTTGHTEAVKIIFDPEVISYKQLVEIYWHQTNPTDAMGQFQDRGDDYRPVIFVKDDEQRKIAEASKQALADSEQFDAPIVTSIEDAKPFIQRKKNTRLTRKTHCVTKWKKWVAEKNLSRKTGNINNGFRTATLHKGKLSFCCLVRGETDG